MLDMLPIGNAGIPMIFLALPQMVFLLLPVVAIEAMLAREAMKVEGLGRVWGGLFAANVGSTFVGWPLAWLCWVGIELLTGGGSGFDLESPYEVFLGLTVWAAWLPPYEAELHWMLPAAMLVMFVPFFFVSVFSERWILAKIWKRMGTEWLVRLVWRMHLYSYAFLVAMVLVLSWVYLW